MSTPLAAALAYAADGIPVLPLHAPRPGGGCSCGRTDCDRPGKHPRWHHRLITAGLRDASTDPELLRRWWRTWPDANVGLRTGVTVDVCDVDTPRGLAALRELIGGTGIPLVRTGSGGWHLYFAATGAHNRVRLLPGVDWRGDGGYVVAPPSRHASGRRYRWVRPVVDAAPRCPAALLRLVTAPPAPPAGPPIAVHDVARYAAAALTHEATRVADAPVGERNNTLYRAARNLGELAAAEMLDDREVTAVLTDAARRAGLGRVEIARTVRSGLTAGHRHPRSRPAA
jgi:hypothetical protein